MTSNFDQIIHTAVTLLSLSFTIKSLMHTVKVERFTGLNIHSSNPMKFFTGILLQCLGQRCSLSIYEKTLMVLLKTAKVEPSESTPFIQ